MEIVLFVVSYILLNILSSVLYVGFLLLMFMLIKKTFNMNEDKWTGLFNYKEGNGLRFLMVVPFLITIALLFPVSMYSFNLIYFEYPGIGYLAVILLPAIILIINLPKLKSMEDTYPESH